MICRLGFIIDFLSHAAIIGFMGGAAVTIAGGQLKGLLGYTTFSTEPKLHKIVEAIVDYHEEVSLKFFKIRFLQLNHVLSAVQMANISHWFHFSFVFAYYKISGE